MDERTDGWAERTGDGQAEEEWERGGCTWMGPPRVDTTPSHSRKMIDMQDSPPPLFPPMVPLPLVTWRDANMTRMHSPMTHMHPPTRPSHWRIEK